VCVIAGSAAADTISRRLADYRFANDAWDIRPAYEPDTGVVSAIVAVAKPDAVIGDNLNVVMFLRDGTQWQAWSWANATRAQGVYSAKMILNISDDDDPKWELDEELPWLGEEPPRPPTPYMAGMLTDDPLFEPVMNSNDPAALVAMLADLGYPVATAGRPLDGGGESDQTCPEVLEMNRLTEMASGAEWGLTQPIVDEASSAAGLSGVLAFLTPYCGEQNCTPKQLSPWVQGTPYHIGSCYWVLVRTQRDPIGTGGYVVTCQYEARRSTAIHRVAKFRFSNCQELECDQFKTGYSKSSYNAESVTQLPGEAYNCPATPSGIDIGAQSGCNALTNIVWTTGWQPPCN
jgi:hypothetical protein